MPLNQKTDESSIVLLKILLHFGFLVSGIITILIGQILPILSDRLLLSDEQLSYFFTAQFAGSLIGTLLTNFLAKRFGFVIV